MRNVDKTILILAANPKDTSRLRLDQEIRDIEIGLKRKGSSSFKLVHQLAARPLDIRRAMLDHNPAIVHFCGHGGGEKGIAFEDDTGNTNLVDAETLADFFKIFSKDLECVVLNACYSESQATAISKHIPLVIGMSSSISDEASIEFSVAFYDGVTAGVPFETSFELACNALRWSKYKSVESEHLTPILINSQKSKKVDPNLATKKKEKDISRRLIASDPKRNSIDVFAENMYSIIARSQEIINDEIHHNKSKHFRKILEGLLVKFSSSAKKLENQTFQVAIIALMKSGKSTLLNAWMGDEFLPSSNTPETANIVRVQHNLKQTNGLLKHGKDRIKGAQNIRTYIEKLNLQARKKDRKPIREELILEAPIYTLAERSFDKYKFEILDTPGPNEHGVEKLRALVDDVLAQADVIIYLLDYTKLKSDEEKTIFDKLQAMRESLIQDISERLFFVVNKIDSRDRNSLNLSETAIYVSNLLRTQIPTLKVTPDRILLVSSRNALLARLVQEGKATQEQLEDFSRVMFGLNYEEGTATLEKSKKHAKKLIELSKLPQLEETILGFIYLHRRRLLLLSVIDDLDRNLKLFHNYLQTIEGTLRSNQKTIKVKVKNLKNKIEGIASNIQEIEADMEGFKKKAHSEVIKSIDEFRLRSREYIISAFEREEKAVNIYSSLPLSIKNLLHQIRHDIIAYRVRSLDRREVENILLNINNNISNILAIDVDGLASNLQVALYQLQIDFIGSTNQKVMPFTRNIEKEIGEALNIDLHPIDIKIELPQRQEFLAKLIQDADRIITSKRGGFNPNIKPKKLGGWFPFFEIKLFDREYEISSDQYQTLFRQELDSMTNYWLSVLNDYVVSEFHPLLNSVQEELEIYAQNYIDVINDNILTGEKRSEQRVMRLEAVEVRLLEQAELIRGLDFIQQNLRA